MSDQKMPQTALVFNGGEIRAIGERLNLTDMWKAAGADMSRQPAEWMRSADAQRFIGFLAETLNLGNSQDGENQGLVRVIRGGNNPRTEAHWQIGLAYAKYLSPEFHAWCNTVVRNVMESKHRNVSDINVGDIPEELRRTDGIARMLAHKVTSIESLVQAMADRMADQERIINGLILAADGRVAALNYASVRNLLDEAKATQKGRNSLNRRIGRELRIWAATSPSAARRCPHSGVWLFPRDLADRYMRERGNALVSAHNAGAYGQVALFPIAGGKKKPTP